MILLLASWVGALACLLGYVVLVKTKNVDIYNAINLGAALPLVISAAVGGLYPQALLSAFYGVVALIGVLRRNRSQS